MSSIDLGRLLEDVSPAAPCGDDLEYDAEFTSMQRAAAGRPPQEMGGQVIPGQEPEWRDVRDRCVALFGRTRDLRVGAMLARALAHTDGLPGFVDGLELLQRLLAERWADVHPRLDPADDNDPTLRMNTLAALADRDSMLAPLRTLPLANSRRLGRFGLRDHEIATGAIPKPEGVDGLPDPATIDAAFMDTDAAELTAMAAAAAGSLERLGAIEETLTSRVGTAAPDLAPLRATLRAVHAVLQQQLSRRGLGSAPAAGDTTAPIETGYATGGTPAMSGPIQSREDIVRVLEQCCDWYRRNEPSSPVPLLLDRAKRLVSKDFIDLVKELSPSGVTEVRFIAGLDSQ